MSKRLSLFDLQQRFADVDAQWRDAAMRGDEQAMYLLEQHALLINTLVKGLPLTTFEKDLLRWAWVCEGRKQGKTLIAAYDAGSVSTIKHSYDKIQRMAPPHAKHRRKR